MEAQNWWHLSADFCTRLCHFFGTCKHKIVSCPCLFELECHKHLFGQKKYKTLGCCLFSVLSKTTAPPHPIQYLPIGVHLRSFDFFYCLVVYVPSVARQPIRRGAVCRLWAKSRRHVEPAFDALCTRHVSAIPCAVYRVCSVIGSPISCTSRSNFYLCHRLVCCLRSAAAPCPRPARAARASQDREPASCCADSLVPPVATRAGFDELLSRGWIVFTRVRQYDVFWLGVFFFAIWVVVRDATFATPSQGACRPPPVISVWSALRDVRPACPYHSRTSHPQAHQKTPRCGVELAHKGGGGCCAGIKPLGNRRLHQPASHSPSRSPRFLGVCEA